MISINRTMRARPWMAPTAPSAPQSTVNVGRVERWISMGVGAGLVYSALKSRSLTAVLTKGLTGAGMLYRGFSGHCHGYQAIGVNTAAGEAPAFHGARHRGVPAQEGVRIEQTIQIDRAPADLYEFWRQFENLPSFMSHLESVRQIDLTRSHWVARGPLGARLEWEAEIINEKPNELIAWESLPGSEVETAGSVHFSPAASGFGTDVRVILKYKPAGGKLGIAVASLIGQDAGAIIARDLDQLKARLEGRTPVSAAETP